MPVDSSGNVCYYLTPQLLIQLGRSLQLPHVIAAIKQLRQQQCDREQQWLTQRHALTDKYAIQLSVASENNLPTLTAIQRAQREALRQFDRKLLTEIDQLVRLQLKRLADLRVPGFTGESIAAIIANSSSGNGDCGASVGREWIQRPVDCQIRLLRSIISCTVS